MLLLTVLLSAFTTLGATTQPDVDLLCKVGNIIPPKIILSCNSTISGSTSVDFATCSIDGSSPKQCFLSGITINQFEYSPDVHTLTIMFNVTTGEEGIYHFNFTGLVRQPLSIEVFAASSEGVINATEGNSLHIGMSILGFSYGSVTIMVSILTYSEYAARGYSLENDFDPDLIPTSAADKYDYPFELHKSFAVNHSEGIVGTAFGLLFPIYDDGIAEDVEGLVLSLEVLGLELDPRDVDFVNLPRSAYIIAIYPSDTTTYKILIGEVDLVTRAELLSVAVTFPVPYTYAAVTEDSQTIVLTESSSIILDWLKWVTEVLGESAINATYTFRRAQLDRYRNPAGPLEQLNLTSTSQNRIFLFLDVEASEYRIQISSAIVRAEGSEDPDRAIYELEACVPVESQVQECYRSAITIYAIPDPIELECSYSGRRFLVVECHAINAVISEFYCIFGDIPGAEEEEMCDLPVVIDAAWFDGYPGRYNFSLVATSTFGDSANFSYSFTLSVIECIQLSEPGMTTLICSPRVNLVDVPLCIFNEFVQQVPCNELHSIILTSSAYPFHIGANNLSILAMDDNMERIAEIVEIIISEVQLVECSTTVNCSSSGMMMSARECCVNSEDGLSYSIPGLQQCYACIVFGWYQESFTGVERESAYVLYAGYQKGGYQAGTEIELRVTSKLDNASISDFSIESEIMQYSPATPNATVAIIFTVDGTSGEGDEWLTLELVPPAPSALLTMPSGEGVFFRNLIDLTIQDSGGDGTVVRIIIGSVLGAVAILLVIVGVLVAVLVYCYHKRYMNIVEKKDRVEQSTDEEDGVCVSRPHSEFYESSFLDIPAHSERSSVITVQSSYKLDLPLHLIIPSSSIKLTETIGQGEFGIVYKGHMVKHHNNGQYLDEYIAIKTLKGFYDPSTVRNMLKECSEMSKFNHPNILTLKGVCLDGGPAPYIIMPFMANGSLLAYLKKNRKRLVISSEDADREGSEVETVHKQLMDMCIQIAKGMEYLATMNIIHRDLAARNCMIDSNFVIKVADFGLSESAGVKEYFRLDKTASVKLPLKWLPPESIDDYVFSEKSDVWAYGVTCWEIFTGGKVPYFDLAPSEIPTQLDDGYRLEKPQNEACSDKVYEVMLVCWSMDPIERPSFSHIVQHLSLILESVSGYIDVGTFESTSASLCSTMTESESNIIQETSRNKLTPGES